MRYQFILLFSFSISIFALALNCLGQENTNLQLQGADAISAGMVITRDNLKQIQIKVIANTIQSPEVVKLENSKDARGVKTRYGVWPNTEFVWKHGRGEWSCAWKRTMHFPGDGEQPQEDVWTYKNGMASHWIPGNRFMEKSIGVPALPFPDLDELSGFVIPGNPKLDIIDLLSRSSKGDKSVSFSGGTLSIKEAGGWVTRISFSQVSPFLPTKVEIVEPGGLVVRQQEIEWRPLEKGNLSIPAKVAITSYAEYTKPNTWYKEVFESSVLKTIVSADIFHPTADTLPEGTIVRDQLMRTEGIVEKGKLKPVTPSGVGAER
jgi:hypothetical protein